MQQAFVGVVAHRRAAVQAGCTIVNNPHRTLSIHLIVAALAALLGGTALGLEVDEADRANRRCYNCHGQRRIVDLSPEQRRGMVKASPQSTRPTSGLREGLYVDGESLSDSVHAGLTCVSCHADAAELPHAAELDQISCNNACHAEPGAAYRRSTHAELHAAGNPLAPDCADCHGGHDIRPSSDRKSRTYPLNAVELCGDCHAQHTADTPNGSHGDELVHNYLDSVHGQAVTRGGLVVAATCVDCHRAHDVKPADAESSAVHRDSIPETCGQCHIGVNETYEKSIHGKRLLAGDPDAPVCTGCHTAHAITQSGTSEFMRDIVNECGDCHDQPQGTSSRSLYDTYRLSYHGQVTQLGSDRGARCSDCHGAHDILPVEDPASRLHGQTRVDTCASCHPGASASFAQFQPHADYRDGENYPILHYVWLYFMVVISSTLVAFGLHSLAWFVRGGITRLRHGKHHIPHDGPSIRRFNKVDRINHALIIITFFGLTITGMPLLFSDQPWARTIAWMVGGVHLAGIWHRIFAVALMVNAVIHAGGVVNRCRKHGVRNVIFGPNSMLPRWRDVTDVFAMMRWFIGGPKPTFDKWTYWEKFDYWAEIFGTTVIGFTGLMLWFPEQFSYILPGWTFNIATVIHGYEAMLAVAFIFTIHFFNAHLRVEKFPVDDVMFTGSLPEAEFIEERGAEYERLRASGELESHRVPKPARWQRYVAVSAGLVAMTIGTTIIVLIVLAGLSAL